MAAPKKPGGNAGKGRPKGSKNKFTRNIKDAVLQAFEEGPAGTTGEGGVEWLRKQMKSNPTAFLNMLGKLLPMQLTNEDDEPIKVSRVMLVGPDGKG
jgi:hypothetical protein